MPQNNTELIIELLNEPSPLMIRGNIINFNKDPDLMLLNIGKMIVGHHIKKKINVDDQFTIYIDVGMSNSMNRINTGQILKIENNEFTSISIDREP